MSVSNRRVVRQFCLTAGLALASILWTARPALAQYWIAPDRSIVNLGRQPPLQLSTAFSVTPVVGPGNMYVRIGGSYSAVFSNPMSGYPGTGFLKPSTAAERARASNFRNAPNYNPNPVLTGPWRKWW